MRAPAADPIDRSRFPVQDWGITENRYDTVGLGQRETIFAVGNGYLGLRGNNEEGSVEAYAHGTFVNGFHETWDIRHAEDAVGFARVGQTDRQRPRRQDHRDQRRRRAVASSRRPSSSRSAAPSTSATACCAVSCCG